MNILVYKNDYLYICYIYYINPLINIHGYDGSTLTVDLSESVLYKNK